MNTLYIDFFIAGNGYGYCTKMQSSIEVEFIHFCEFVIIKPLKKIIILLSLTSDPLYGNSITNG